MRILHRYIWYEFMRQFLICAFGFSVLGIGKIIFDYNDMFIGYRITSSVLIYLVLNRIPILWMDVLPAAALFGVILGLGRLLREREYEIIRLSGASLLKVASSIILGVALFCFMAFWWNDLIVPAANARFQREINRLSMRENLPLLKENVVFKAPQNRFIFLKKVFRNEGKIAGILIIEAGNFDNKWPRIITAKSGRLKKGIWELYNGIIHETNESGAIISELSYKKMNIKISKDLTPFISDGTTPATMSGKKLWKYYEMSKESGVDFSVYAVYFHQKFADSIISFVLVFLAIPLTIMTGRNSRWLGLVSCFLIIMAYYTMQVIGRTMGINGVLTPWLAAWIPHLVFLTVGSILFSIVE